MIDRAISDYDGATATRIIEPQSSTEVLLISRPAYAATFRRTLLSARHYAAADYFDVIEEMLSRLRCVPSLPLILRFTEILACAYLFVYQLARMPLRRFTRCFLPLLYRHARHYYRLPRIQEMIRNIRTRRHDDDAAFITWLVCRCASLLSFSHKHIGQPPGR